jgi:hypothetical protein
MNDLLWLAAFGLMLMIIRDARALAGSRAGEPQRGVKALDAGSVAALRQGQVLVDAEAALDKLFADRQAAPERVDEATQKIAALQGGLRAEHLNTHLAQTALMSAAQAQRYAELRGTTGGAPVEPAARGAQHKHRH